jgi:hypothetical protein
MAKKNKYCGKIKVGMNTYKIQRKDGVLADDGHGLFGQANHCDFKITLAKGYGKQKNYQTLWHEIFHIIANERSLDLSEEIVSQISNGLVLTLHDNPQLLPMIMEERFIKDVKS